MSKLFKVIGKTGEEIDSYSGWKDHVKQFICPTCRAPVDQFCATNMVHIARLKYSLTKELHIYEIVGEIDNENFLVRCLVN